MRRVALLTALLVCASGCYRTHYLNLQPPGVDPPSDVPPIRATMSGWQSFFLFGWVPKRVYDASTICGPANVVEEIRTQQTFAEGLVDELCSYYINVYSPYNAEIFCVPDPTKQHPAEVAHQAQSPLR